MEHEGNVIQDEKELQEHISSYYKRLFGSEDRGTYLLVEAPWSTEHMLSELDNEELTKPFTMEVLELVVKEMKTNTAPGPDGLPVIF